MTHSPAFYLVAGGASGDSRGAELMRAVRALIPGIRFYGVGGSEMRALAGDAFVDWADEAVVGLWDVLKKYGYFKKQFERILSDISARNPDAVILIDYPGFNLRLARALRRNHPSIKIIYYISPQVWAWNRRRIPDMARSLDLMLCIFAFERELYEKSGLKAVFVGHPMLDALAKKKTNEPRDPKLIGLFPGSREKEVRRIFPVMLQAAEIMAQHDNSLRFEAAAASDRTGELMRNQLQSITGASECCTISVGTSHALMQRAAAGMVASGTATLEAAFFGMPLAIIYKVAWLTWVVAKRVVTVPFIGMPNILADREIAREFLQEAAEPEAIAREMLQLVGNPQRREAICQDLDAVVAKLGEPGAAQRAARVICEHLGWSTAR